MSPPTPASGRPSQPTRTAATTETSTTQETSPDQNTQPVYPSSFAEWDRLIRERPYGRGWAA